MTINKMLMNRGVAVTALSFIVCFTSFAPAQAQKNDPVIMTIAGQPVLRSEFEYSYNKNNAEGVIDKKSVEEYVDLFVNYKMKVKAAMDAHLDTLKSFKDEFATYRNQQVRPSFITEDDVEAEARNIYNRTQHMVDSLGGLIHPSHILLQVKQQAPESEFDAAKVRIDSIYQALKSGADFADMAKKYSDDKASAVRGGDLNWIQPRQTVKEFEDAAFALKPGEMSQPVRSPFGYHIILMQERRNFFPYDSLRTDIIRFINARGIREQMIDEKVDSLSKATGDPRDFIYEQRAEELSEKDSDMKNLIREYHDGLLLFEIGNRKVWDKATKDEAGLAKYFAEHRDNYDWEEPESREEVCEENSLRPVGRASARNLQQRLHYPHPCREGRVQERRQCFRRQNGIQEGHHGEQRGRLSFQRCLRQAAEERSGGLSRRPCARRGRLSGLA